MILAPVIVAPDLAHWNDGPVFERAVVSREADERGRQPRRLRLCAALDDSGTPLVRLPVPGCDGCRSIGANAWASLYRWPAV